MEFNKFSAIVYKTVVNNEVASNYYFKNTN